MIQRQAIECMATRFELVMVGDSERALRSAGEAALAEIGEVATRLTRFERASLVGFLEREAHRRPVRLDDDLLTLFELCADVERLSGGAFRITRDSPGTFAVDRTAGTLALTDPGTRLDLGAVGKGFAIDLAVRALRESGAVSAALIHGGTSSVYGLGAPPTGAGWSIGIGHDGQLDGPRVLLADRALSVSAQRGRRDAAGCGHLVDARAGHTADPEALAAVTAPSAAVADAWSTALALLGPATDGTAGDDSALHRCLMRADIERLPTHPSPHLTPA